MLKLLINLPKALLVSIIVTIIASTQLLAPPKECYKLSKKRFHQGGKKWSIKELFLQQPTWAKQIIQIFATDFNITENELENSKDSWTEIQMKIMEHQQKDDIITNVELLLETKDCSAFDRKTMCLEGKTWSLKEMLLAKPELALFFVQGIHKTLGWNDGSLSNEERKKQINRVAEKVPFILLSECSDIHGCFLTRVVNPSLRATLEDYVIKALIEKITSFNKKPVHYVSFASGALFSDLVILTKTLNQVPGASIVIHIIDPQYKPYTMKQANESLSEFEEETINTYIPHLGIRFNQFTSTLKTMFPQATIELRPYAFADNYFEALENKQHPYPDVIVTSDIGDDSSYDALIDYKKLLNKIFNQKPNTQNFLLGYNRSPLATKEERKPEIISFAKHEPAQEKMSAHRRFLEID